MLPQEYVAPYLIANAVALGLLAVAFGGPRLSRWIWATIFLWAACVNTVTAATEPAVYLQYGPLTPSGAYRAFIDGWFSHHIQPMVWAIAAGQLTIAILLLTRRGRRVGVLGAIVFLLAIAPLGVGAGFPFSVTAIAALLVMERGLARLERRDVSPASRFVPSADVVDDHVVDVDAPAALVFATATHADLLGSPVIRAIFHLRRVLLGDHLRPRASTRLVAETLSLGWGVLEYAAGRRLVMGAVAAPWQRDFSFTPVEPSEFAAFAEPGLVKIVWTLECEPRGTAATRFRTETRVAATDAASRRRFRWYWRAFSPGIRLIRWNLLRDVRREAERRHRAGPHGASRAA